MTASPIVHVRDLVKEFRTPKRAPGIGGALRTMFTREQNVVRAVDGISFDIAEGELVGYLGRNGAGKSTTIKMLTGILVPTSGEVIVSGRVPWRERERNALDIGVVFGQRSYLWWDLPLIDSFELIRRMYRMDAATYRRELDRVVEMLELGELLGTPVRQLSLGQRMRGDLAAAILYRPRILYLDEPTVGVDVLAKEHIRAFIAETNRSDGTTVVLTTHDLRDVERLCRRLILIERGTVLFDGSIEELRSRYAVGRELVMDVVRADGPLDLPGVDEVRREGSRVWLAVYPDLEEIVRRIFAEQTGSRA